MRNATLSLSAVAVLLTVACSDRSATDPLAPSGLGNVTSITAGDGPWARVVEGKTGPGSLYALYIPQDWNGKAIYFAHGIRPPADPITLNDQDNFFEVRDALGRRGYAFAYSSFSENGLAVKDGVQRTHQLRGLLASELNQEPTRNYLAGYSLGGLVALELAERFPTEYDGALTMCGMVGGTQPEVQYVGDVRALFDFYYPGVLPGNAISVPTPPLSPAEVQARVIAAITPTAANPRATLGLYAIASTAQTPLAYAPIGSLGDPSSPAFQSLVQSLITALYYQLLATPNVVDHTHGHSPYGNRGTTYALGTLAAPSPALQPIIEAMIAASNLGVTRYEAAPDAQNYIDQNYSPTGDLKIPVVSVHNLWDPLVPVFHEDDLAGAVLGAGASSNLVQQRIPAYGHCNFSTALVENSFLNLVSLVEPPPTS